MRDRCKLHPVLYFAFSTAFLIIFPILSCASSLYALDSAAKMYYSIGQDYMEKGKFDMAVLSFQKAVESAPDWAEAHNALGEAYTQVLRFEDALAEFDKAIELKPDYTQAKINSNRTKMSIERYAPVKGSRLKIWHKFAIFTGVAGAIVAISLIFANKTN